VQRSEERKNNIKLQKICVIYRAAYLLEYNTLEFADVNKPLALKIFECVKL
jgi:hypothetical protein